MSLWVLFFSAFEFFLSYVAKRVSRPGAEAIFYFCSLVFVLLRNDLFLLEKSLRVQFGRSKIGTSMRSSLTRRQEDLLRPFSSYLLPFVVALSLTSLDSHVLQF